MKTLTIEEKLNIAIKALKDIISAEKLGGSPFMNAIRISSDVLDKIDTKDKNPMK